MSHVVIYSRPDCHLCELVERVLRHMQCKHSFELTQVNIDLDPVAHEKYKHDIPVVTVNGKEISRHRLTAAQLEQALQAPAV